MTKTNQLNRFIEEVEELKDEVFEDGDVYGYFVVVVDKRDGINVRYSSSKDRYPQLAFAVDLMLLDLKNQLVDSFRIKDDE